MAETAIVEAAASTTMASSTPTLQNDPRSSSMQPTKSAYKSWRKKYYKMRHRFQTLMGQNHKRFEEEQNTIRLARRLQEQNDQLLQLLYDSNVSERLPAKFRYDIQPKASLLAAPNLSMLVDGLEGGESTTDLPFLPAKALAFLESIPHSSLEDLHTDPKAIEEADKSIFDDYIGYLSPTHEAEYLAALEAFETKSRTSNADVSTSTPTPHGPWSNHDSAGAALKNPVSVYNWLKKNQPSVFLNDTEEKEKLPVGTFAAKEDKPSVVARTAPTKVQPKRASVGARHHAEEVLDEDGFPVATTGTSYENTGSMRGKRKQNEDDAYRPKGGSSRKKKKLSSGPSGLLMNDSDLPS